MSLHGRFEAWAARTPDAPAVQSESYGLSYGALNARANRLARFLRGRGVGQDVPVGVCADSGVDQVVALLAVLKAGGAYLPLDPACPAERLRLLLEDSGAALVLTRSGLRDRLPGAFAQDAVAVDADAGLWADESACDLPQPSTRPDDLAYIIYTSGSTGPPKGVELTHGGADNNLAWRQERFPLSPADRMLQTYSFSFDPSVWAIFWPLSAGATLVLPRAGGLQDADYLARTLADRHISVAGFSPSQLGALLSRPDFARCPALRHVFCGGEPMPAALPARFYAACPRALLHNAYGPTEATIDAACWTVPPDLDADVSGGVPIGFPVRGADLWVLDAGGCPAPDGETGELYVGGAGLARGYRNAPGLTRARFLAHPFDDTPGARLYRTGDLARRGPDGAFFYAGRVDSQIKLRGFRIEPGEIEAALGRHPDVCDSAILLREDRPGEPGLAAYVVAQPGRTPDGAALRRFLSDSLPAHLVPAAFVLVPEIPLTLGGKRDPAALPPPGPEILARGDDFCPPETALQGQIARLWEDLLGVSPVGLTDSFWDLGGHSLLAARLLDQLSQSCGRPLPPSALYDGGPAGATVERLALLLSRGGAGEDAPALSVIKAGGDRPTLFFLYGFLPLGGFYCHPLARRLPETQPLSVLHPPASWPRRRPLTVEAMAEDALGAVRLSQPHGPYRLGGFCGSALVALEMARRLMAEGEVVEFLALVEVHGINARARLALRRLCGGPKLFRRAQAALLPLLAGLQSAWRIGRGRAEPGTLERCDRSAAAYVPPPYAGPVHLLRAGDDSETVSADPLTLWREIAPQLTVHNVPGTHLSCLGEHVGALGAALGVCLASLDDA